MKAVFNGVTIADSDDTIVVEGNHYFPPDSVRWEHLSPSRARSVCPWKGLSSYYHVHARTAMLAPRRGRIGVPFPGSARSATTSRSGEAWRSVHEASA